MILVDSSVWIDYFRGLDTPHAQRLDELLDEQTVAIGDLILTEVLQGFNKDRDFLTARRLLTSLTIVELGGRDIALHAAANYRSLRALGVTPRKTIDTIIATRCIVDRVPLLYSDRDFDPFVAHFGLISAVS